jgi:cysteine desulfurase
MFFTDATQAAGKIPVDVRRDGIDIMALSAHKMYGPKGVGALYLRRKDPRVKITAQMDGGGHERGIRSGTINVPGVAGFGRACEICHLEMDEESTRIRQLRDRLENGILNLEQTHLNGSRTNRLPNITNISFTYVDGEALLTGLAKYMAVSSGSACTSASMEPSYVLKALGLGDDLAHSSLRFGLGRFTTGEEVEYAIGQVCQTVNSLRASSPLWEMYKEGAELNLAEWTHR